MKVAVEAITAPSRKTHIPFSSMREPNKFPFDSPSVCSQSSNHAQSHHLNYRKAEVWEVLYCSRPEDSLQTLSHWLPSARTGRSLGRIRDRAHYGGHGFGREVTRPTYYCTGTYQTRHVPADLPSEWFHTGGLPKRSSASPRPWRIRQSLNLKFNWNLFNRELY